MGYISYKTPWVHFRRRTDEYVLYVIKSGELCIQENDARYVLKKGDLFVLEANVEHEGFEKHPCDYYYVHFRHSDISRMDESDSYSSTIKRTLLEVEPSSAVEASAQRDNVADPYICYFPKHFTVTSKTGLQNVFYELNEMIHLFKHKNYNWSLTALKFAEFLIKSSREYFWAELQTNGRKNSKAIIKVHALLSYIHQNYPQKINSETIEFVFESNFDSLNRTFSQLTGYTIIRYLNMVRISHAKELIEATHLNFSEIGYLVGVGDPFYFSKVFKKYTGLSPKNYYLKIRETVTTE